MEKNQKIKREKKIKIKGEKKILPGVIVVGLIISMIIYAVLLNAEKNALADYEKGTIYVAIKEIPQGQMIQEDNYTEYFRSEYIDVKVIPPTAVTDQQAVHGLIAKYSIEPGTLITQGMFRPLSDILKHMEKPVIAGFKADDLYQVVGGVLRAGDRIHIYKVDEETGEAITIWEDIFIQAAFDQSGLEIGNADPITAAQRINVYLDKDDVENFYTELATGSLRVALACD